MKKLSAFVLIMSASISFVGLAGTALAASDTNTGTASFSAQQREEIKKIIHDDLVDNPEVLIEATRALQAKEEAKAQKTALKAIQDNKEELFNNPEVPAYYAGKGTPSVTLVEFFDYQCGHCKNMVAIIKQLIKKNKNLKVSFREFPFFGSDSEYAAKAALASVKQGKYYAFHNALFKVGAPLTKEQVVKTARSVGLDVEQLQKDMQAESANIDRQLKKNRELGEHLHLMGTPAFVLGVRPISASDRTTLPTQFLFIPGETSVENLQAAIRQQK